MNKLRKMMVGSASLAMIAGAAAPAAAQNYPQYGNQSGGQTVGSIINNVLGGGRYGSYGQGRDARAVDQCARAAEAQVSADSRYGPYGQNQGQYGQNQNQYGQNQGQYGQGYANNRGNARVVAVTQVTRNVAGIRVSGLIDTGRNYRGQGQAYQNQGQGYQGQGNQNQGYQGQGYPQQGYQQGVDPRFGGWNNQGYANAGQYAELTFNCRVDLRGQVIRVNVERNMQFRRGN